MIADCSAPRPIADAFLFCVPVRQRHQAVDVGSG